MSKIRAALLTVILGTLCSCFHEVPAAGQVGGGYGGKLAETKKDRIFQQEEIIRRQKLELERQQRELEDLQRQDLYNQQMQDYTGQ